MKIKDIHYAPFSLFTLTEKIQDLTRYLQLSAEYGCVNEGKKLYDGLIMNLEKTLENYQDLVLEQSDPDEPNELEAIRSLRIPGPRRMINTVPNNYPERLRGAFYGRMAGCTLGAALEFQSVNAMRDWAEHFGDQYPLVDYWSHVKDPTAKHYIVGQRRDLTKWHMNAVPPDDDTIYTLLGLLTLEQYGLDFTQNDLADVWKRYLPLGSDFGEPGERGCWWGERKMLTNLLAGIDFPDAGVLRNPNLQNIAGWTRADSYGYACPGWPEKAAELAYKDASANHRRNGVYGSMFMAATISAAFVVNDPIEAVRIGLTEIPKDSLFAEGIQWALDNRKANYREAAEATWAVYSGMFNGSALTNAIHVVMGLDIGGKDFSKTIGETIAMSGDNDCTGATAGSIVGAVIGKSAIPVNWTDPFQNRMHIYLREHPEYLSIEVTCKRFETLAKKFMEGVLAPE
jgi:ADP-ribosylglycohydrolase